MLEHTWDQCIWIETIDEARGSCVTSVFHFFRREAGSYGKDTKGILRAHQFDKLVMESFARAFIQRAGFFVAVQEYMMQGLKLPYQVVMVCTGDMGSPDARQIDIET